MIISSEKCTIEIKNDPERYTYSLRMQGFVDLETMTKLNVEAKRVIDSYQGSKHLILADMRGLKTMPQDVSRLFHEMIAYDRANGAYKCAHLSDSTVQALQMRRITREISPDDSITVNVVSQLEAEKVLQEALNEIAG